MPCFRPWNMKKEGKKKKSEEETKKEVKMGGRGNRKRTEMRNKKGAI